MRLNYLCCNYKILWLQDNEAMTTIASIYLALTPPQALFLVLCKVICEAPGLYRMKKQRAPNQRKILRSKFQRLWFNKKTHSPDGPSILRDKGNLIFDSETPAYPTLPILPISSSCHGLPGIKPMGSFLPSRQVRPRDSVVANRTEMKVL